MASKSLPSCKIEAIGRGRVNSSAHIIRTTSFVAIELSRYAFESLRSDKEFHLCRGRRKGETSSFAKATEDKSSRDREDVARSSEAHEDLGPSSILFLSPVSKQPSFSTIKRLEHEYSLRDELHPDWAIRPLALTRQDGRTVLVFEDPGSELLERLLGQPMEPLMFLRLAISLAAGLRMLHSRGLIHKDIKPANIFVDTLTRKIWLTGFGISSRLTREKQALEPPETIAGTLAYMAPEQTGRMNRSIDSRSDLYSLGVTLYQMLTGCLPFTASDPMEWVHCHIARQPTPPVDLVANVPASVSAIIMKLLAKTAEERYQTAAGVEADLRRCLDEYLSSSGVTGVQDKIPEFPLGQHDTPNRLFIPEKLYGREREIESLLATFERVVESGRPELVLVSGYSGIGKSSVVNELHKVLVPPRGLFASGKFDQYKGDIPYSTLAQAFRALIRPLLAKTENELDRWRDALSKALGPNARLIADLVPELKLILGEQPQVPELPPQDAQRRFQLVFRRFVNVFARREHPLALFLDDLQWLDPATLDLLEDLPSHPDLQYLMLIGAYRDNEVDATHPLIRKLNAIRQTGARVQEIRLEPLTPEDLAHLISDSVHCRLGRTVPLASLVHSKTGGNPFFAIQFVSALAEEGLLSFDHDAGRWSWDLEGIHAKGYTDNVVDLMVGKLSRLPVKTQKALQELACLGNSAGNSTISIVHETSEEQVHCDLWEAVRLELIARQEGGYTFVHDRIQEAAYSLIPEHSRAKTHLKIGRLLWAHLSPTKREEAVFEIANQLNRGAAFITSPDERERLASVNLNAGKRAKASTAYHSALNYLATGTALVPEDAWERRYELAFALELQRAECEFLTGALVEAEARLALLASRAASLTDLAQVTRLRVDLFMSLGRSDRAVAVGLEYLHRVGIDWSAHPTKDVVRQEYARIWRQLGDRPVEALLELPPMTDPVAFATMDVLASLVTPALFTDQNLRCLVIGRMGNVSLEHGNCDTSPYAYTAVGTVLGPYLGNYKAGFRFGQLGLDLVEQPGMERLKARVYLAFGNLSKSSPRHVRIGRPLAQRVFETAQQVGDLTYAALSRNNLLTYLLASGEPLAEVQRDAEAGLDFARQAGFSVVVSLIAGQLQLIRSLRGLTLVFGRFDEPGFDEEQFERQLEHRPGCLYWIRKLQARVLAGDNAAALAAAGKVKRLLWMIPLIFERAEYHFYAGLALAALYDAASPADRTHHRRALAAHCRHLKEWAEHSPENFASRAGLLGAEIARLQDRVLDAERLYEQAIQTARTNSLLHDEATAYERASAFYRVRGFDEIAALYLQNARRCYLRWGADGKVRQLDELFPHL